MLDKVQKKKKKLLEPTGLCCYSSVKEVVGLKGPLLTSAPWYFSLEGRGPEPHGRGSTPGTWDRLTETRLIQSRTPWSEVKRLGLNKNNTYFESQITLNTKGFIKTYVFVKKFSLILRMSDKK